jgi:hypothetical protein
MLKINEDSEVQIPVRNLISLIILTAVAMFGYYEITSRIDMLEKREMETVANSEFRIKWPRGELGSLPADASQNQKIEYLESRVSLLEKKVYKLEEFSHRAGVIINYASKIPTR